MARDKSIRNNRDNEGGKRHKRTLSDHRRNRHAGYQDLADIMFNGGKNKPKR